MKIEKRTIDVPTRKMIKQGRVEHVDTGESRERVVFDKKGNRQVEIVPIVQEVFHQPVFENVIVQKEIHCVKTETGEEHHFSKPEDAQRFISDTNNKKRRIIRKVNA